MSYMLKQKNNTTKGKQMANRYRFSTKKKIGRITKLDDTVFADNIEQAIFKMLDNIDHSWVDKNRTEIEKIVKSQTSEKPYAVFVCEYDEKNKIESFIEQIDGTRLMS